MHIRQRPCLSRTELESTVHIAYLASFAPKKLGTGENRLMALAQESTKRKHRLTLFCYRPVHKDVEAAFREAGQDIADLSDLVGHPFRSISALRRDFDAIVLNAIAPRSRLALLTFIAWPTRVYYVDHSSGPAVDVDYASQPLWRRVLDRITFFRIHRAAGVSKYVRDRLRQRFQLSVGTVRALYGGVDVERFRPSPECEESEHIQIAVVAALIKEKGIDALIRAVATKRNPRWRLWIIGEGPDSTRLRGLVEEHALEDVVEFLGLRDDVDELLRKSDIFVHPAVWNEALGYTILEGMASGCAVIASETGAIPELIDDGVNGYLVAPGSVDQIADKLELLSKCPELRKKLGREARRTVVDRFSLQRNICETLDWLEKP